MQRHLDQFRPSEPNPLFCVQRHLGKYLLNILKKRNKSTKVQNSIIPQAPANQNRTPNLHWASLFIIENDASTLSRLLVWLRVYARSKHQIWRLFDLPYRFYLSQTVLERGESQLQIMPRGPKTIST